MHNIYVNLLGMYLLETEHAISVLHTATITETTTKTTGNFRVPS